MIAEQDVIGPKLVQDWPGNDSHRLDESGGVVEGAHGGNGRKVGQAPDDLERFLHRRPRGCRRVLGKQRDHHDVAAIGAHKLLDRRCDRRKPVAHAERDPVADSQLGLQTFRQSLRMDHQRGALRQPDLAVGASGPTRPKRQDHQIQQKRPDEARKVEHAWIRQKFAQEAPHIAHAGRIGRTQLEQQNTNRSLAHPSTVPRTRPGAPVTERSLRKRRSHPASGTRHPASGIRHPVPGIRHPGVRHPGVRRPASGIVFR